MRYTDPLNIAIWYYENSKRLSLQTFLTCNIFLGCNTLNLNILYCGIIDVADQNWSNRSQSRPVVHYFTSLFIHQNFDTSCFFLYLMLWKFFIDSFSISLPWRMLLNITETTLIQEFVSIKIIHWIILRRIQLIIYFIFLIEH